MNPLHLSGLGVEIQASNPKPHAELMITDGRRNNNIGERYLFLPRRMEYDSIILENCTGHVSLAALRWLSKHNIPIFFLDFDGSIISSILPPAPIKADMRVAQIQTANDLEKKFTIARALVQAKIARSLQVLDWLGQRYDIQREAQVTKREAARLAKAATVNQLRTVEGRVALHYWKAFRHALPESLHFEGRMTTSHNNNASDATNAALNYSYGFIKILCRMAINSVGLEPAVGYLHETSVHQTAESLVYDLMEPYRWLADLCVIQAFETGALNVNDFAYARDDYVYRIQTEGRKRLRDILIRAFNVPVPYKGRFLKWDTTIEEKTNELGRHLIGLRPKLDFSEPAPTLKRQDDREVRENILSLTQFEATELGIGKSTLHYLRKRADNQQPFRIYSKVREKIVQPVEPKL
jgi:CRISPR-associated protein Cas1